MAVALAIFGLAFAAFCLWLTVRIVNRRERWAKWTLATVVGVPVLYAAGFAPLFWIDAQAHVESNSSVANACRIYAAPVKIIFDEGPYQIHDAIDWCRGLFR
jgi:hypothetical protein